MDYEKAYKAVLQTAKQWLKDGCTDRERICLECVFPELRESEDERMRKRAIAILKQQRDYWSYDGPADKFPPATRREDLVNAIDVALSCLEKQKESLHIPETCKENANSFTSEDERIRKCIGMALTDVDERRFKDFGVTLKDCLAYLEKQEQKHAPDDLQKSFEAGQTSIVDNPEQYGLCKKTEWSEEDENMLADTIFKLAGFMGNEKNIAWLKSLPKRFNLQPKQEWSEEEVLNRTYEEGFNDGLKYRKPVKRSDEDKKMSDWLIGLVNANTELSFKDKVNLTRWLEHLTIEKELSKNDKRIMDAIIIGYQDKDYRSSQIPTPIGVSKDEVIDWLKSLRPSWKPSEEDIKMLEHIIGQYETGNKNSKVMGYLPRVEELSFLKKVLSKWKN